MSSPTSVILDISASSVKQNARGKHSLSSDATTAEFAYPPKAYAEEADSDTLSLCVGHRAELRLEKSVRELRQTVRDELHLLELDWDQPETPCHAQSRVMEAFAALRHSYRSPAN